MWPSEAANCPVNITYITVQCTDCKCTLYLVRAGPSLCGVPWPRPCRRPASWPGTRPPPQTRGPVIIFNISPQNRKRINTEVKAKVVAAVWGLEFIQFLVHYRMIWIIGWIASGWFEEKDEFKSSQCKIASTTRNFINSVPQTAAATFDFSSVFILLLCSSLYI